MPIKYKSEENNRIFEYESGKWHYYKTNGKKIPIPNIAFYVAGKNEELNKYKAKKIIAKEFLSKGKTHKNPFNIPIHLFIPIKQNGKLKIKKIKELTKIET